MIYNFLRLYFGILAKLHYKEIKIIGKDKIQTDGPLLIYSNHPNVLIDPILITSVFNRKLTLIAKSTLGKIPLFGKILNKINVQLIHRKQDGHDDKVMKKNIYTLRSCSKLLEEDKALLIFPEGKSYPGTELRSFKTGISRITADFLDNSIKKLKILPVYINYKNKSKFRSDVEIIIGDTIDPKQFEHQKDKFVPEFTNHLRNKMLEIENSTNNSSNKKQSIINSLIFALTGIVYSILPLTLILVMSKLISKMDQEKDTVRIAVAFIFLPVLYIIQIILLLGYFSATIVAIFTLVSFTSYYFNIKWKAKSIFE